MEFLKYCFTISIISLAFDLVWRVVAIVILLLLIPIIIVFRSLINKQQYAVIFEYLVIKSLNYYLITSLIFTATFFSTSGQIVLIYVFTGGFLLVSLITAGMRGTQDKASDKFNLIALKMLKKYDVILLIFSLVLYIIMFFVPQIGATYITVSTVDIIKDVINWIWRVPIIGNILGFILGIIGVLFILGVILTALGIKPEDWEPISYIPGRDYRPSNVRGGGSSSSPISS